MWVCVCGGGGDEGKCLGWGCMVGVLVRCLSKFTVTTTSENELHLMIIYFWKHIIIVNINTINSFTLQLGYQN